MKSGGSGERTMGRDGLFRCLRSRRSRKAKAGAHRERDDVCSPHELRFRRFQIRTALEACLSASPKLSKRGQKRHVSVISYSLFGAIGHPSQTDFLFCQIVLNK